MLRDVIPATGDYWLRDARVSIGFLDAPDAAEADREGLVRRDLRIEGGRIAAVEPAGTAPGLPADLVLFGARGMTELLSRPQSDRVVLRRGRVVRTTLPDWRELDAVLGV